MVQGVRGQGGSRGKSGTQRSLASAPFVRCQFSICHDNIGKILRVALSQLDKRGISEGAGKLHEHYFFECVIATINDRQYSSCGNRVDLELPSSASTSRQSPLFPNGSFHACRFHRLTRPFKSKQANSIFLSNICAKNLSRIAKRPDGKVHPWLEGQL